MFKQPAASAVRSGATAMKAKAAGDISSVFPSLSGVPFVPLPERFTDVQRKLISGREEAIKTSWNSLLVDLEKEVENIANNPKVIPEIDYSEISSATGRFSSKTEELIKKTGAAVIKNVIPEKEARQYKYDLDEFIAKNPDVKGFPNDKPSVYELYWSKSQLRARSHPNLLKTQSALMQMWHGKGLISTKDPLSYADRFRIRPPGDAKFALGPHVDGGSVERWEDPVYAKVYDAILGGNWRDYDPFDYTHRLDAVYDLYQGASACSMMRMFQGWVAMSHTGPGEGTLKVCPMIKHATAYLILRPFFAPKSAIKSETFYDETVDNLSEPWEFVGPAHVFPNATMGGCQELNTHTHPHLQLDKTMISMPTVNPGDYVVWHCDGIHAVESKHDGQGDSSVMYIPATPMTRLNLEYLSRQRATFRELVPPPDFPGGDGEKNFTGHSTDADIVTGRRAMGLLDGVPYDTTGNAIYEVANEILLE
ncbi:hypothetical protein AWJ20_673 [Sugiyamaella lignohabitans]|uniref:DUF1479-domain-containing protein n=1 Tax=Sugiyamaella lignohabitans TaxID=796027 RepID=A0A167D334_9ASCO|nr:uncharacterized protein AWJ20_673 [Sugiyamaella lignohabitans]ANB12420.1 hypothetical protein AWJ20_673 [Sugiyamaella lignohabitans]